MAIEYDKKRKLVLGVDNNPDMRTMMRRTRNIYHATPDEVKEAGMQWYGKVHTAAKKAVKGMPGRDIVHAAGVIAAVSPNMDWERDNISAFDELASLKGRQWKAIHDSAAAGGSRSEAATDALQGMGLAKAPDVNLVKAHRIFIKGEHPDVVLNRRTAPKTHSFHHNIAYPDTSPYVTMDGRMADEQVDARRPWKQDRGIDSSALISGKQTRYDRMEEATQRVAAQEGIRPLQLQAINWEMGKIIERNHDPERSQGGPRIGQSYSAELNPPEGRTSSFNAGRN